MKMEGRFAVDPQDAEIYVGGESVLCRLLRILDEGDEIRLQVDRIAHRQEVPMFQPRGEIVRTI
jgi:hypothetical protein